MGHTSGSRGGGGGRASQSRSSAAASAGLGGGGTGIGGRDSTAAQRRGRTKREKSERQLGGVFGTFPGEKEVAAKARQKAVGIGGKIFQGILALAQADPLTGLLVGGATKAVQSLTAKEKLGGVQARDLPVGGIAGPGETREGTLLAKGAATPAEAVAAQPDAAAKELEKKRRRGRGRTQTILAGRKIAEEQRAKTLLGQ